SVCGARRPREVGRRRTGGAPDRRAGRPSPLRARRGAVRGRGARWSVVPDSASRQRNRDVTAAGTPRIACAIAVIEGPGVVCEKALAVGAEAWLEALPELVRRVEDEWSLTVGRPYRDATEAFVAEATCDDGTPAVLKLIVPRDGDAARREMTVLRLAAGRGCPR